MVNSLTGVSSFPRRGERSIILFSPLSLSSVLVNRVLEIILLERVYKYKLTVTLASWAMNTEYIRMRNRLILP